MKIYKDDHQANASTSSSEMRGGGASRSNFLLDYPISVYEGAKLFIGMNMIGVRTLGRNGVGYCPRYISQSRNYRWNVSAEQFENNPRSNAGPVVLLTFGYSAEAGKHSQPESSSR